VDEPVLYSGYFRLVF